MKNKEKFIEQCIENIDKICDFLNVACEYKLTCNYCSECRENFAKWLEEEYVEKLRLSHDEYIILKNVDKDFGWLARNKDSLLIVTSKKPHKKEEEWYSYNRVLLFILFQHLFQFVKWDDEEPYNIQELLDEYEKYHNDN